MSDKDNIGKKGEEIAQDYLRKNNYAIIETNWRYYNLEIDIIAKKNNELVIIEVKARSGEQYGHPSEAITRQKMKHLINAAEAYIMKNDINIDARFDVITVIFHNNKYTLEHFEDAFYS